MAKKIKFPLKLKDDFQVRTLEELKEHFDLDKVVAYFLDGKLLTWLKARYYEPEIKAVRNLRKNDPELQKKLCQIFGIEHSDYQLDINEVEERNRRLGILRQFTSDPTVLEQVASVAFNQEDLGDLLDDGVQKIFLCNNSFVIPLGIEDKTYIGIGKTTAVIRSNEKIDFDSKHISFQDISFDPDYQKLIDAEIIVPPAPQKDFYQLGLDAENSGDYNSAIDFYLKALEENNNADINFRLGWCYEKINDFVKAYPHYLKAANLGNTWAMNNIAYLYFNGQGVSQNYTKGREWLEKAVNNGNEYARYWMGRYFIFGQFGYSKDRYKGESYVKEAAYNGNVDAMLFLGDNYYWLWDTDTSNLRPKFLRNSGVIVSTLFKVNIEEAGKWYRMATNFGSIEGRFRLIFLGSVCNSFYLSGSERFELLKENASLGDVRCMMELSIAYSDGKLFNGYNEDPPICNANYFTIEENAKKSLDLLIESISKNKFYADPLKFSDLEPLLNNIYKGDSNLLDDIKKQFPWFYPNKKKFDYHTILNDFLGLNIYF